MRSKRVFIFIGNPDHDSFSTALAESYAKGAQSAGHEVRIMHIADMRFDPILHRGYKVIQQFEPDLVRFQENVKWSEHFVSVFPIWWSDIPALMKGLVDRVWMPGFAFNFRKGLVPGWYRRLKGRSARVIVTSDTHPLILWALFGGNINSWVRGVLRFSGFAPVRKTWFSGMKKMPLEKSQRLLSVVEKLGRKAK
ncbi:MAG TPA: NAD(P)H-dependent oxidoreductase [Candidatus Paceibacterota bacterium]|nr:NAD(P)H-dependent oxidoreductase [Candidatus Paceibacterota bacterium]